MHFLREKLLKIKFIKYLIEFKQTFLLKNPREKWLYVRNVNIFFMKFTGIDFMTTNFKLNILSYIPFYIFINYTSLLIYTLYYYRHKPLRALQATPAAGIAYPVRKKNQS